MVCFDLNLIFDLAIVTWILKSCSGCILETVRCTKLILSREIGWGVGVQYHGLTLT